MDVFLNTQKRKTDSENSLRTIGTENKLLHLEVKTYQERLGDTKFWKRIPKKVFRRRTKRPSSVVTIPFQGCIPLT